MGMATYTENQDVIRSEFKELVHIFNQLKKIFLIRMILKKFQWECQVIIK